MTRVALRKKEVWAMVSVGRSSRPLVSSWGWDQVHPVTVLLATTVAAFLVNTTISSRYCLDHRGRRVARTAEIATRTLDYQDRRPCSGLAAGRYAYRHGARSLADQQSLVKRLHHPRLAYHPPALARTPINVLCRLEPRSYQVARRPVRSKYPGFLDAHSR